tara:strand:+ start:3543 stop:3794 length:252 start_codon:yes stop_codon:yes gene_type:complete
LILSPKPFANYVALFVGIISSIDTIMYPRIPVPKSRRGYLLAAAMLFDPFLQKAFLLEVFKILVKIFPLKSYYGRLKYFSLEI